MPRRGDDDRPDPPEGGGAAARLHQFLEARGLEEPDDSGETGAHAGPEDDQHEESGGLGSRGQGRQTDEDPE